MSRPDEWKNEGIPKERRRGSPSLGYLSWRSKKGNLQPGNPGLETKTYFPHYDFSRDVLNLPVVFPAHPPHLTHTAGLIYSLGHHGGTLIQIIKNDL